jgi:hypothetical protein
VLIILISLIIDLGSFSWTLQTSKYFKLPTFLVSRSRGQIMWVVETERHLFLGEKIITLSPTTHIKLDVTVHTRSQHFCFLVHCSQHRTHFLCVMAAETDHTSLAVGDAAASNSMVASGAERDTVAACSSSNAATQTLVKNAVSMLFEYWK